MMIKSLLALFVTFLGLSSVQARIPIERSDAHFDLWQEELKEYKSQNPDFSELMIYGESEKNDIRTHLVGIAFDLAEGKKSKAGVEGKQAREILAVRDQVESNIDSKLTKVTQSFEDFMQLTRSFCGSDDMALCSDDQLKRLAPKAESLIRLTERNQKDLMPHCRRIPTIIAGAYSKSRQLEKLKDIARTTCESSISVFVDLAHRGYDRIVGLQLQNMNYGGDETLNGFFRGID